MLGEVEEEGYKITRWKYPNFGDKMRVQKQGRLSRYASRCDLTGWRE